MTTDVIRICILPKLVMLKNTLKLLLKKFLHTGAKPKNYSTIDVLGDPTACTMGFVEVPGSITD